MLPQGLKGFWSLLFAPRPLRLLTLQVFPRPQIPPHLFVLTLRRYEFDPLLRRPLLATSLFSHQLHLPQRPPLWLEQQKHPAASVCFG